MKKTLGLLLCFCMIIYFLPALGVSAASPEGDFIFDDAAGTITGYSGPGGDVEIPAVIGGTAVISIGNSAFGYCGSITGMTIPDSVASIGNEAFYHCDSMTGITIPSGVTSIGVGALRDCGSLTSILIHAGNTVYKSDHNCIIEISTGKLIAGCKTSIIPDYITSVGDFAFFGCSGLTDIILPGSVSSVGDWAFSGCSGLTDIVIPDGVASVGEGVFYRCSGLTGITIPESIASIGTEAFNGCSSLTGIAIPGNVVSIGMSAFGGCRSLTGITIPDSVASIDNNVFNNCSGLTSILVDPGNTVYKSENNCIIERSSNKLISGCKTSIIPDYTVYIGDAAFNGCIGLTDILLPGSVVFIGEGAFDDCIGLTDITIPDSVTHLGDYAFAECSGLTDVILSENITSVGNSVFRGCSSLTGIILPDDIASVGMYAFAFCYNLTNITIPDNTVSIGSYAFYRCYGLKSITIPGGVTSIGNGAFDYCSDEFIIYGFTGSYAETYAAGHGYNFVALSSTVTITALPSASAITYGQTLADSLLTGGAASVDGVFAWTDGSIAPVVSDSGTTLFGITFTPADGSYKNATAEISVSVRKAVPIVSLEDCNAVYNGNVVKIKNAGVMLVNNEVYGGPVSYTYYTDQSCKKYTQKIHGAAVPGGAPGNIGIYYVKATVDENDNYTSAVSDTARLTISLFRPVIYYRITASAGTGGSVTPSDMSVRQHSLKIFMIVPDKGYETADVKVDGVSVGKVWYYIFPDVTSDHTIHAEFRPVT